MPGAAVLLATILALSTLIGVVIGLRRRPPVSPAALPGPPPSPQPLAREEQFSHSPTPTAGEMPVETPVGGEETETGSLEPEISPQAREDTGEHPEAPETPKQLVAEEASHTPQATPEEEGNPQPQELATVESAQDTGVQTEDVEELVVSLKTQGLTVSEIARRIGRSRSYVYRVLRKRGLHGGSNGSKRPRRQRRKSSGARRAAVASTPA